MRPESRLVTYCALVTLASICYARGFWIKDFDSEEDDNSITFEDVFRGPHFNSRGPRSVYRGLENDEDFFLVEYSDYQDFDFEYSE